MYSHEIINGKDVYIFRDHHHALLPWSKIRSKLESAPILVSLDHHTDTRPAYLFYILNVYGEEEVNNEGVRGLLASKVDYSVEESVREAINKLRNDEHIHAATISDIIKFAFVIQLMDSNGTVSIEHQRYIKDRFGVIPWRNDVVEPDPPFSYEAPGNKIFVVPSLCLPGCDRMPHNDECEKDLYDRVIDDRLLEEKVREANDMAKFAGIKDIERECYILDVDLDYFHTKKSIDPESATIFYRLIRNAVAVTIALEPKYVASLALEGEEITSEYLLEKVRGHIACA